MKDSRVLRRLNAVIVLMTTSNTPISTAAVFVAVGSWRRVSKEFYRMKKAMICALLTVAMACCGIALYAQTQDSGQPMSQGMGGQRRPPMTTDARLQHMTQMLNLTSDQQTKIRPILDNESTQMQSLREATSMPREEKMAKMKSIREATNSQITPILTSEQQEKWQQMQAQRRPPQGAPGMGAPAGDQGAPPPTPPQQ
jgi:Spy/CpxP family protein refolding chaperone